MTGPRLSRSGKAYAWLRQARNRTVIAAKGLRSVDPKAYIHPSSHVAADLVAAEYVYIGRGCDIAPLVEIGRYTMLASNVAVVGDDHNWSEPGVPIQFAGRPAQRPTRVGSDVWLGEGVIVLRGVSIGDGSIVAAGAVVTRDIPEFEIWAGVPARKVGDRFEDRAARQRHRETLTGPLVEPRFAERREDYEVRNG